MGFYYFILFFLGLGLALAGALRFKQSRKNGFIAGFGMLLITLSIFLFQPGSSDIIAKLLGVE